MRLIHSSEANAVIREMLKMSAEGAIDFMGDANGMLTLMQQPEFVSITKAGFFRAQFFQGEISAESPIRAVALAFLRTRGVEVTE